MPSEVSASTDATLPDVVEHYNTFFGLKLGEQQKGDLVEYLKSL